MERWMNAAYAGEDEEIYMEGRVDELMSSGQECDPDNVDNITEALSECSKEDADTLRDYLAQKDWEKFGRKVWAISFDYMERRAESYAQDEVSAGDHL